MSKRSDSITCFLGTREGVLTERASTPSGGDLEPESGFDKRNFQEIQRIFAEFSCFHGPKQKGRALGLFDLDVVARYWPVPNRVPVSIFTPGPIVEDSETRLM